MIFKDAIRAACLAATAITAIAMPPQACAQPSTAVELDLAAQDLGATLRDISRATGREIIYMPEVVAGLRAPPLRGRFTAEEAVTRALAGTGLVAEASAGALIVRSRASTSEASRSANAASADITVTGTRIRDGQSPSPIIVSTRRALLEAGANDLADFTRLLPQNFTGGQNPGVAGGGSQGGQSNINNSATLNLRGLGPDATLTLLNGHRIAYDALNQGIDISAIPLAAVDRIEVIADGASALYGSDAVGGVANIILRRSYEGLQTSARIGASTAGGNLQQQAGAVGGADWSSGGFMAVYDFSRATPILAGDRDYITGLDPSQSLTLRSVRHSLVVAGRQDLTPGIALELDGFFSHRRSRKQTTFFADRDVLTDGLLNRPLVRAWSVAPTLRIDLPAGWQASLVATAGVSRTEIDSSRFDAGVESRQFLLYENRMRGFEANAEGPLFRTPGGVARLAVGAGLRRSLLEVNVAQNLRGSVITTRDFTDSRDVQYAFGELSFPLVGPELQVPAIRRLTLSAALRYERHEAVDEVVTPKLGLVYQPYRDLILRASWGRSFKAPTLDQLNQLPEGALIPGSFFLPPPVPPLPDGDSVLLLAGGNAALRAERAATWSASAEWTPAFAEGLRLQASVFDIDYRGRIAAPVTGLFSGLGNPLYRDLITFDPAPALVEAIVAGLPLGYDNLTGAPLDPARVGAIFDISIRNAARERARGVDLALDYDLALGATDRLLITGAASYLESERQLIEGQPFVERAGRIFNPPHWRGRLGATWRGERASLAAALNYVGAVRDARRPVVQVIRPFVTLDLNASFRSGAGSGPLQGVELRLSLPNLLGERPALIRNPDPGSVPFDSTNQSAVGRFIGLSVTKAW
ncbi:TonB-dependent receptor [Sphingosinicella terrae]|uniref:TonB-dependent receptor n=1 Tax=Sphingosinicella terrae TaxID=2172047 RepID=UPI000E0DE3BF|nr:TonB-dependent receptor [Sphingosinicella terrae]